MDSVLQEVLVTTSELDPQVRILHLPKRLDTLNSDSILEQMTRAIDQNPGGIILNLAQVAFVSSMGIRVLVLAYKQISSQNGKIAMIHVHPNVYKIFKMVSLEDFIPVHETEAAALAEWQ